MVNDPALITLIMFSLVGGLLLFAGLLLSGVWLIRFLKLPTDLPEGPRFEAPPPPLMPRGDRVAAAPVAAQQQRFHALFATAHRAARTAFEIQEYQTAVKQTSAAEALRETVNKHAAEAKIIGANIDTLMTDMRSRMLNERNNIQDSHLDAWRVALANYETQAQTLMAQVKSAIEPLTELSQAPSHKRIIILVILLIIMLLWVFYLQDMLLKPPAMQRW
jgi:hypothetical protein